MKIALAQTNIIWNDPEKNLENYRFFINQAHASGVELLVFPEMFNTGFSFPTGKIARQAQKLGCEFLEESALQSGMYVAASMPKVIEKDDRPFNTLYLYGSQGCVGEYSKIHLISALNEDKVYQSGNLQFTVRLNEFRISFFICYDLRFPQVFSTIAEKTDLYVIVANWPSSRKTHWEVLLAARAIENQAFVAGVNRIGHGGGLDFDGGSRIISPMGELIECGGNTQQLLVADLDIDDVLLWRKNFRCLKDKKMLSNE